MLRRTLYLLATVGLLSAGPGVAGDAHSATAHSLGTTLRGETAKVDEPWAPSARARVSEMALLQDDDPEIVMLDEMGGAPRRWWPILLSAALPGLGEATTGHGRGWFMMAADAGLWYGVKDQHDLGKEKEDEFEAFALKHWSEDEWRLALFDGDLEPYFGLGPGTTPEPGPDGVSDVPLYVSREEDEREWFENLGKWDVFSWGWREYWEDDYTPGDPDDPQYITPLRQQYLDLRGESNAAFQKRDRFMTVALLFRVASVLQVAYLEGFIGGRYTEAASEADGPRAGWFLEPQGLTGTQIGWKVSY